MPLKIVDNIEEEEKTELCCENHNEMRIHISRILSNWYDMILGSDEIVDDMYSQRMHFRYACKSRLNWSSDQVIERLHDTLMDKHFMIENVENNDDMKVKMEASAEFDNIDHTICVFLQVLQEITIHRLENQYKKLENQYEEIADYVENLVTKKKKARAKDKKLKNNLK